AAAGLPRTKNRLEQFGASRADKAREDQDLAAAEDERNVLELAFAAELAQFQYGLGNLAMVFARRLGRRLRVPGDERHDLLAIQIGNRVSAHGLAIAQDRDTVDKRGDFLEPVAYIDDANAGLCQFADQ